MSQKAIFYYASYILLIFNIQNVCVHSLSTLHNRLSKTKIRFMYVGIINELMCVNLKVGAKRNKEKRVDTCNFEIIKF